MAKSDRALTTAKKADRLKMAKVLTDRINALPPEMQAKATLDIESGDREDIYGGSRTMVKIDMARNVGVSVEFNGKSVIGPDRWLLSYHFTDSYSDDCFSDSFAASVNPHHYRKASDSAHNYALLLLMIDRAVRMCADGSAFCDKRKAGVIRKNGETGAQRKARRDAYDALPEYKAYHDAMAANASKAALETAQVNLHNAAKRAGLLKDMTGTRLSEPAPKSVRLEHLMRAAGYPEGRHTIAPAAAERMKKDWSLCN